MPKRYIMDKWFNHMLTFAKKNIAAITLLTVALSISLVTNYYVIHKPKKLKTVYESVVRSKPRTLKKVKDYLLGNDLQIRVIKRKFKGTIYLDFFSFEKSNQWRRINTVKLEGSKEGFFEYWNDSLSLALIDENGDGFLEVVAPTFSHTLKPHINIVFYNKKTKKFELKQSPLTLPQAL